MGGFERQRGFRWAALGVLVALAVGVPLLALEDLERRRSAMVQAKGAVLRQLGRFAEASLRGEAARRSAELRQLRAELRSQGLWQQALDPGPADDAGDGNATGDEETQDRRDAASRQLAAILRRALHASDGVRAFQILVADEQGISSRRLDGETTAESVRSRPTWKASDQAEDLWYAEDVRRAVVAAGHRVESSPLLWDSTFGGEGSRAGFRRAIALHDADELIQGVLVAELDPSAWVVALAALPGSTGTLELRSPDGRSLVDAADQIDAADRRAFEWVARVGRERAGSEVFESGGQLVAGGILAAGEAGAGDLIWLARSAAPESVWASARRSPWLLALGVLMLAIGMTVWGLGLSARRPAARASGSVTVESSDENAAAGDSPEAHASDLSMRAAESVEGAEPAEAAETSPVVETIEATRTIRPTQPSEESDTADVDPSVIASSQEAPSAGSSRSSARAAKAIPAVGGPELFVLRDWLSDVRSCLEREAARRGLALEMRCARALPSEIESDPVGLGALLLALGRDALDGTAEDRISIDVVGSPEADLRFELDVGDGPLRPPPGLEAFATELGAEIQLGSDQRIALVLARTLQ